VTVDESEPRAIVRPAHLRQPGSSVLPTGTLRRTSRLLALPLRHAARTAAAATGLSHSTADEITARGAEQVYTTLGELKGGAAKLGQAMSVFEAAIPGEVAGPYRSALNRLTDAAPAMPAAVTRRGRGRPLGALRGGLAGAAGGPRRRAGRRGVHRPGAPRPLARRESGNLVEVAVKVQYPGVAKALRSDLRAARALGRVMGRMTGLDVAMMADELAVRMIDELDYPREGRVQQQVAAAFARTTPKPLRRAHAAGVVEPPGRTNVVVPRVYAATPRLLISGWLDGAPLTALLDGRDDPLPAGWRELDRGAAASLAGQLIGHALYAPAACAGWIHADPHPGNFLLLPGGRLGLLDFGSVAAMPDGLPEPLGRLAAAVLAGDGPAAVRCARLAGVLAPDRAVEPRLLIELLRPVVATAARDSFTYSPGWLRALMAHLTHRRFAAVTRQLTAAGEYALIWRALLSVAGLYARLSATVPSRGFELAYSPGFRHAVN